MSLFKLKPSLAQEHYSSASVTPQRITSSRRIANSKRLTKNPTNDNPPYVVLLLGNNQFQTTNWITVLLRRGRKQRTGITERKRSCVYTRWIADDGNENWRVSWLIRVSGNCTSSLKLSFSARVWHHTRHLLWHGGTMSSYNSAHITFPLLRCDTSRQFLVKK